MSHHAPGNPRASSSSLPLIDASDHYPTPNSFEPDTSPPLNPDDTSSASGSKKWYERLANSSGAGAPYKMVYSGLLREDKGKGKAMGTNDCVAFWPYIGACAPTHKGIRAKYESKYRNMVAICGSEQVCAVPSKAPLLANLASSGSDIPRWSLPD
jgi:hypothetical protein